MDINAKKIEVIQHIIFIQNPETIIKIDRFIHGLDYEEKEEKPKVSQKSGATRANVIGTKIKGMLNLYK